MATKSIIDIEVNDEAFTKFLGTFKKFQEHLDKTPDAWKTIGKETKGTALTFENMAAALLAQTKYAHELSRTQRETAETARKTREASEATAAAWRGVARSAASFAGNIFDATKSILKWASVTTAMSGLLGAGGLFGIDRLAVNVSSGRRSSLGLGVSYGEQAAFAANYGRVVDPSMFLGGTNEALHDVTKRVALYGAGLSENDLRGKDTAQVANELLPAIKRLVDQTPDNMLQQVLSNRHLDQFVTLQDAQRLKATPANELSEYQRQYAENARTLDLTQKQQKAWQDLQVQLHIAGAQIETTLIKGLTGLATPINDLSTAFTHAIADLLASKQLKEWIDDLGHGIEWLAREIQTDEFHQSVKTFSDDVIALAKAVSAAVGWFSRTFGSAKTEEDPYSAKVLPRWRLGNQPNESPDRTLGSRFLFRGGHSPMFMPGFVSPAPASYHVGMFDEQATQRHLPLGLLDATFGAESSYGTDTRTSSAGAEGPFQIMPDTWKRYGHGNVQNVSDASEAAAAYYEDLLREFNQDPAKAAAAYNWGPQNVENDVKQYGKDWRSHLPKETSDYVTKILAGIQAQKDRVVLININNNTGGNAIVSASQLTVPQ